MKKLTNRKHVAALTWLCTVAYFASYVARTDFAAVLTAFVNTQAAAKTGIDAAQAGLIITAAFFSYGIGQLLSGYLGDKIPPKHIIFFGFLLTGGMNLLMPFGSNIVWYISVWAVNGFAHAMMWPPMTKILTAYLSASDYVHSVTTVCAGANLGSVAVYLLAAALVDVLGWTSVLYIAAAVALVVAVVWIICMTALEKTAEKYGEEDKLTLPPDKTAPVKNDSLKNVHWKRAIVLIMIAIVAQGYLRDGISTWLPKYLQDTFSLNTSGSLLATVLLPIFNIAIMEFTSWLYRNYLRNETLCAGVYFGFCALLTVLLTVFFDVHVALSLIMVILVNGAIHGINLILVCMISPHFRKYGKTSVMSGALNFCTYIGSGSATYTIALIFEYVGWRATIASWSVIALVGALCCVFAIGLWKKFVRTADR